MAVISPGHIEREARAWAACYGKECWGSVSRPEREYCRGIARMIAFNLAEMEKEAND
jgi:hypothetical protein